MPIIDINTSDFEFDAYSPLVTPAAWYNYGVTDGLNSYDKRTLEAPFDIFQQDYEDGFDHGVYMKVYLVDPRP